jgi:hypothetical protein
MNAPFAFLRAKWRSDEGREASANASPVFDCFVSFVPSCEKWIGIGTDKETVPLSNI